MANNLIDIYADGRWNNLNAIHPYGEVGGRSFENDLDIVDSVSGGGSILTRQPARMSASFDLTFAFEIFEQRDEANEVDDILKEATAIRINGYVARCVITLNSEELEKNQFGKTSRLNYTVNLLDTLFWATSNPIIGFHEPQKMRSLGKRDFETNDDGLLIRGDARWRLSVEGRPNAIIVQATKLSSGGQGRQAFAFGANGIALGADYNEVIIDNFALESADLKAFYAKQDTGEVQDLSQFIDTTGNGFFDLGVGTYSIKIYIFGNFTRYTFESFRGYTMPYVGGA